MTREEAIDLLDNLIGMVEDNHNSNYDTALQMAIKALEQEPCEDCISRQAAIDACLSGWNKDYKEIVEEIRALPPVTPQPKTGHWIDDGQYAEGHSEHACRCSKCGYTYIGYTDKYKECPHCRARMDELTGKE